MGIGDWFPTKGEAEGQIRIKGSVGAKGGRMASRRFQAKAKRRRQTKPENSSWFAYNPVTTYSPDDEDLVRLSGGSVNTTYLTISPLLLREEALYPGVTNPSIVASAGGPQTARLMRFDGKIRVIIPKFYDPALWDADFNGRPLFIYYAWRRVQANAEETVMIASQYDTQKTFDEGRESWRAMTMRNANAPLKWGTFFMQPDYRPSTGWVAQQEIGGPNSQVWPAVGAANYHQRMVEATIPFPRLPKGGLKLTSDDVLRLEMQVKVLLEGSDAGVPRLSTVSSGANYPSMLPFFRYLVSFDD